jgi:beta-alanine degradation protein BauB
MTVESPTGRTTPENPGEPGTLLYEDERVRVWELVLAPGERCEWHRHDLDHLLIVVDGCRVGSEHSDGRRGGGDIDDRRVIVQRRGEDSEIAWNESEDRTLRELIVELKDGTFPATTQTKAADLSGSPSFGFFG